ncbi:MAG: sigma-70 family RNA polymerase sigma factor [Cyclobacteriaceae bacterium]
MKTNKIINIDPSSKGFSIREESDFKEIYDLFFFRLIAYARIITKSEDLARDAVADVFLNLWNTRNQIAISNIDSYLLTSTKNQCYKILSKEKKSNDREEPFLYMEDRDFYTPEALLLTKETLEVIRNSIENLPSHARLVFKMVKEDGFTYEQVAGELQISKNTVRNHLYRAVNQIRSDLDNYFSEENKSGKRSGDIDVQAVMIGLCIGLL